MSFVDLFADDLPPPEPPEPPAVHERPAWLGPPDGELGAAVPLGLVLARGERGVIALSHALAYSTGISFDLVAHVDGLEPRQASGIFHAQHEASDPDDLPEGFLRFGLELPDGARVSNLGGRRPWAQPADAPPGPILNQQGGSGGRSTGSSISWSVGFWLWPLPPPGALRVFCEWPVAGIGLASAELDAAPLLDAATRAARIWEGGDSQGAWTQRVGQHTMQLTATAAKADDEAVAVPAAELRAVQDALQAAVRTLRRLER